MLGLVWAISSIGASDNYAYLFCTIPLFPLSIALIVAAQRPQLEVRVLLTGLSTLIWCSITLDLLARSGLSLESLRGVFFYAWAIWLAGDSYARLRRRLEIKIKAEQESRAGIVRLHRQGTTKEGIK